MKEALLSLLNNLDEVEAQHEEVTDTEVRDQMHEAIYQSFIMASPDYTIPQKFGMYSASGNSQVRKALSKFLSHPEVMAARTQLQTPAERLEAFQDSGVVSSAGTAHDEYFGYREGL